LKRRESDLRLTVVRTGVLILALASASLTQETAVPDQAPSDLAALLPKAGEASGWTPKGVPRRFKGQDLFLFINGGAEIYHEYGFREVMTQDYEGAEGRTVALEVFEMADPAAAYGMFTFKSSGEGRPADVGQDSELEDYYLNFWQGPYLVTVTGSDDSSASLAGVLAVGRAVGGRVKTTGVRPATAALLPPEWAGPRLKYLRGPLGLYNLNPVFSRHASRFEDAVAGAVGGNRIFVLRYRNSDEAQNRWAEIKAGLAENSAYRNVHLSPAGAFEAMASDGARVYLESFADLVVLVLGSDPPAEAQKVVGRVKTLRPPLKF